MVHLFLCFLMLSFWTLSSFGKDSTQQVLEESVDTTMQGVMQTTTTTETDFVKKCVNIPNTNVECDTKKNTASKKSCIKLKCDASNSMVESAEVECETTSCDPINAQVQAAQAEKATWDGCSAVPYTALVCKAKAALTQIRITELQTREQTCRAECQACKARDLNDSDDYNNKSVCGGTYGVSYDTAISSAKAEAAKLEQECRTFCKGKEKLNWVQTTSLVLLGANLLNTKDTTEKTGDNKSGAGAGENCALKTDETARTICYCSQVAGYTYAEGKGCVPTDTTGAPYSPSGDGASPGGANPLLSAYSQADIKASTKTGGIEAGSSEQGQGKTGAPNAGAPSAQAGDQAESQKENRNKESSNLGSNSLSPAGGGQEMQTPPTAQDAGSSDDSDTDSINLKAKASDIAKQKAKSPFEEISTFLSNKYNAGGLKGGARI